MISIEKLKEWVEKYKFGKYISKDELFSHLDRVAKKSLEEKLTCEKGAELNEKKKVRLHEELKGKPDLFPLTYKCPECGRYSSFLEEVEIFHSIDGTPFCIGKNTYPPRICEKCGGVMKRIDLGEE